MHAAREMQGALEEKRFLRSHGLQEMPTLEETVHRLLELEDAVFALAGFHRLRLTEDSRGNWHVLREEL